MNRVPGSSDVSRRLAALPATELRLSLERLQLLLAEQQALLTAVRIGAVTLSVPLVLMVAVVALATYADLTAVAYVLAPVVLASAVLFVCGAALFLRSFFRYWRLEERIELVTLQLAVLQPPED